MSKIIEKKHDVKAKKTIKVLITGKNSYVGLSLESWLKQWNEHYFIETIDMIGDDWRTTSFASYDVVFHVAGIAHVSADPKLEQLYFKVNRDLAIETAQKAKNQGVKQFIFMSSMIVYGGDESTNNSKVITSEVKPNATDFYGKSKLEADIAIRNLADGNFRVAIMRPPVLYGPNCKGNFPRLIKIAQKAFVFPDIDNKRSMIYIDNFCEFVKLAIDNQLSGVYFPQNAEYISTKNVISVYRKIAGKRTRLFKVPKIFIRVMSKFEIFNKAFGTKIYSQDMSNYGEYRLVDFESSMKRMFK